MCLLHQRSYLQGIDLFDCYSFFLFPKHAQWKPGDIGLLPAKATAIISHYLISPTHSANINSQVHRQRGYAFTTVEVSLSSRTYFAG